MSFVAERIFQIIQRKTENAFQMCIHHAMHEYNKVHYTFGNFNTENRYVLIYNFENNYRFNDPKRHHKNNS